MDALHASALGSESAMQLLLLVIQLQLQFF